MPILSLLIPTRERAKYLRSALQSCLAVDAPDIEIIVSDNASRDGTKEAVAAFDDPRILYVNTGQRVSMRENFELAVTSASGDYLVMIGDDDAVVAGSVTKLIALLRRDQPDLVRWSPPLYGWPSTTESRDAHLLVTQAMVFGGYTRLDTGELVTRLYDGSLKSQRVMPSIYHGCISRRLMDQIKARTGHFFGSGISDCYVSFAGCILSASYILLEHPVTIAGASPASNASYDESTLALFVSEVRTDPVPEPLDISSMITPILYLSTLIAADRVSPEPKTINWSRWIERSVAEIRQKYPDAEVQDAQIASLHAGVEKHGGVFPPLATAASSVDRKRRSKRAHKLSLSRIRLHFDGNSTVMDAVKFIEDISSGYAIRRQTVWSKATRPVVWAKTLIKSALRAERAH